MEKAAAFPLHAGFMPNSPMPMLDVCDWLLLMTVSTICGGCRAPLLPCGVLLLPPVAFVLCWLRNLPMSIVILLLLLMVVGVEELCLCCVVFCVGAGLQVLLF